MVCNSFILPELSFVLFRDFPPSFPIFNSMFLMLDFPVVDELDSSDVLLIFLSFSRFFSFVPLEFSERRVNTTKLAKYFSEICFE